MKRKKIVYLFTLFLFLNYRSFAMQETKELNFWGFYNNQEKLYKKEFERVVKKFIEVCKHSGIPKKMSAIKRTVNPDSQIAIHADIHGDISSTLRYLEDLADKNYLNKNNPFKIKQDNFYLAFLGDYVDRGKYGVEVLYVIMRLVIENPGKIILLRGNHENYLANKQEEGVGKEFESKFWYAEQEWINIVNQIYACMPVVAYINVKDTPNYALLCHAGLEPRFNPHPLFLHKDENFFFPIEFSGISWLSEDLQEIITKQTKMPLNTTPTVGSIGFLWNDFILHAKKTTKISNRSNKMAEFSKLFTEKFLAQCSKENEYEIKIIIRGHDHSGEIENEMINHNGIYNFWASQSLQWNGKKKELFLFTRKPIWMLNVSPGSGSGSRYGDYYGYDYDTYAILHLPKKQMRWKIKPHNVKIQKAPLNKTVEAFPQTLDF